MKKLYIETYGCQMNVADSEVVASVMQMAGYETTGNLDEANAVFLNTCSVRDNAEQKIYHRLEALAAIRRKRPLIIGVLGCMAERAQQDLLDNHHADLIAGPDAYLSLPDLIAQAETGHKAMNIELSTTETYKDIVPQRIGLGHKIGGFVSIMRGCNNFCHYCIVPYTRGRERSRDVESILKEVRDLRDRGFKEVTLLGQNVNSYSGQWTVESGNIKNEELIIKSYDYTQGGIIPQQSNHNSSFLTLNSSLSTLFSSSFRRVLILGLVIAVFQQWCGTNVIFNYAQEIFTGAGYDVDGMFIDIVITGVANVIFTIVALYTIEKWGRRTLILLGAGGLGLIYLTLGTCYFFEVKGIVMVCLVVAAISTYAMTLGPVTWTLLAEIFPNRIRGIAMATCTFALWVGCCTLTFSFPSMNAALGSSGSFWIYSAICFCAFIFLFRRCPETKGKSLEELEQELTAK